MHMCVAPWACPMASLLWLAWDLELDGQGFILLPPLTVSELLAFPGPLFDEEKNGACPHGMV